ncbi:hypothetical protein KKC97_06570 [bacterium]|nr:hypothetical protein [bacterium]MBU1637316.1 hypothetical protein [bacterium]MBU1920803.1 hypothetical protein [bacterium]
MIKRHILIVALCLSASCLSLSCNAPHDNPLDPESKYFNGSKYSLEDFAGCVRSLHTSRSFPTTDVYSVIVEGSMSQDVEMDSVWVIYRNRTPVELERLDLGLWGTILSSAYFNTTDPQMIGVMGQPFVISFAVTGDEIYTLEPLYLIRLIEETPRLISPAAYDTVGQQPLLKWETFSAPYEIRYQASVWRDEVGFEVETWSSDFLPDSVHEIETGETLVVGNYYWVLYVIDEFLNRSRSHEGEFVVREEAGS